jgi:hypothetical protein
VASTTRGVSKKVNIATSATAIDPVDLLGNAIDTAQGLWVYNSGTVVVTIHPNGVTATTGGDDGIPIPPGQSVWFAKPGHSKASPPVLTTGQGWSGIAATAGDIYITADNGAWHPYR